MFRRSVKTQTRNFIKRRFSCNLRHFQEIPPSHATESSLQLSPNKSVSSDRSIYNNVLNTSQLEVTTSLQNDKTREKFTNLETKIRLSHFLESLFRGDYASAIKDLDNFRKRCVSKSASDKNIKIYTSCFITLLTQAATPGKKSLQMQELAILVTHIQKTPELVVFAATGAHVKEIQSLVFAVLIKNFAALPKANKLGGVNLIAYIRDLQRNLAVSLIDILNKLVIISPKLVPQYNQVFQQNATGLENSSEDFVILENALESLKSGTHALSFNDLCEFIEKHPFDAAEFTGNKDDKFYQIYDNLPADERKKFMEKYARFNSKKQLLIEDVSQNVYKSVSSPGRMIAFTQMHRNWVKQWVSAIKTNLQREIVENDALKKFGFIFNHLSPEHIASLCLTKMLSATVPSSHAKVLSLALDTSRSIRRELMQADKVVFSSKNMPIVFDSDHGIEFVCSTMNIIINSCRLPDAGDLNYQVQEDWGREVFQFMHAKEEESTSKFARYGAIKAHPIVAEHFKIYQELFQTGCYNLPMIHQPKHWMSPRDGGYFSIELPLVKSSESSASNVYMYKAHKTGQLSSVYQSVNALGECPWTINPYTLEVFNKLMKFVKIPGLPSTLAPQYEINSVVPLKNDFEDEEKYRSAYARWRSVDAENAKKKNAAHNLRVYYTMVNRLANSFARHGEVLYLPHSMDFRGRVYPAVSFLSHQGEDLVRSLMMFWEAKRLGPHGYDWLVYQFANLYSKTKMTMDESREFVGTHKSKILQSASNPCTNNSWWANGDNPWQVLAMCDEFRQIWAHSGNISEYKSRIPVHQDGSCNGLQHYSALGADTEAARAVNVLPDSKMQDVYVTVLELVKQRLREDDVSEKDRNLAKAAQSVLSRRLIKQTVMTTVYGVTAFGATKQVRKRIEEYAESQEIVSFTHEEVSKLSVYISRLVLSSISDLFAGAKLIQNWLVNNCMRSIQAYNIKDFPKKHEINFFGGKHYRHMTWTSLSGFPVIQMYRKRATRELQTPLQKLILNDDSKFSPIDEIKSRNGIAPNFIHSIDAIHLLMTCLAAKTENITFASVHDSFWTHASEVEVLSRVLREEFARLHGSDIIENLRHDMMSVAANSFQLVWVDRASNPEFVKELEDIRSGYSDTAVRGGWEKKANICLRCELKDNSKVLGLLEKFQPSLIYKVSATGKSVLYDDSPEPETVHSKITFQTHMAILASVKILKVPAVGTLDISTVLKSKYFFS